MMKILFVGQDEAYQTIVDKLGSEDDVIKTGSVDKAIDELGKNRFDKIITSGRDDCFKLFKDYDLNAFFVDDGDLIQFNIDDSTINSDKKIDHEVLDYSIESLVSGFAVSDLEGNLYKVNQTFLDMWGYDNKEEVLGKSVLEFWKEIDDPKKVISKLENDGEWTGEMKAEKRDGSEFYVETFASLVRDEEGVPLAMTANFIDITDRKKMEEDLRQRERRFRMITENAHDLIAELDMDANFIFVNEPHKKITGYDPEELIGKKAIDYIHPDHRERALNKFTQAVEERNQRVELKEYKYRCKDGSYKWFNTVGTVITDEEMNPKKIQIITRDITERKKAKEELKKSKDRFQALISNAQEGIYIREMDGTITYVNEKFADIHGYEKDELIGLKSWKLKHPDSREKVEGEEEYNREIIDEDKSREIKVITKDGKVKDILCTNSLLKREDGENEIFGIVHDISDRKEAEDRVEFLLTLLRHDLKNKTQVVRGYLQLLKDFELDENVGDIVDKALEGIVESQDLIKKVGTIKDIEKSVDIRKVNLKGILMNAVDNYDSIAEEKGFEIKYGPVDFSVSAGSLLEEMFSNLIENSIKHSEGNLVRISGEDIGDRVRVTVEDDGIGIEDDVKRSLFERGKKGKGSSGLGMGMYLVKRISDVYDGDVEIRDSDLGGARFDIYLNKD